MPSATVVKAWTENGQAHLAVRVAEANGDNIEYIGSVDLTPEFQALTQAQKRATLVAAVKAVRDAQQNGETDLGITGSVTV